MMTSNSSKPSDNDSLFQIIDVETHSLETLPYHVVIDEMEEFYECGPDPWLAERLWLDQESEDAVLFRKPASLVDLSQH